MANILEKVLPWIGAAAKVADAAGVPFAGTAATAIGAIVGKPETKPTTKDLSAAIAAATPEQLIQMKQIDDNFAVQMKQLDIQSTDDLLKLAVDDTASARQREMMIRDKTPEIGFYLLTALIAAIIIGLFRVVVPAENKAVIYSVVGGTVTAWNLAIGYFYGTSRGSENKTAIMAQQSQQQKP